MKNTLAISVLLLFRLYAAAQSDQSLKKNYERNYSKLPYYYLNMTFNQPLYSPGDTVWFNSYFLKEDLTKLSGQYLFEFNLIDHAGISRLQFQFLIVNGQGSNQFVIPQTLEEGIYLATVYNNYSRNFGSDHLYKKEITIVKENQVRPDNLIAAKVDGGNLIEDVSTELSVSTVDAEPDSILLLTGKGRIVDRIWMEKPGTKTLRLVPQLNTSYHIASRKNNRTQIKLPTVMQEGCNIHLVKADIEKIEIGVDYNFRSSSNKDCFLLLTQAGKVLYLKSYAFRGLDSIRLEFLKSELPNGIIQCQVVDVNGKILSQQSMYNQQLDIAVEIISGVVHTESSTQIEFSLHDASGNKMGGEFSVSVINNKIFDVSTNIDSMGNGPIDPWEQSTPVNYFSNNPISSNYPLFGSVERSGRAMYSNTGEYLATGTQILIYLQKSKYYLHSTIGKNGLVRFALPDLYYPDEIYYAAFDHNRSKEIRAFEIRWDSTNLTQPLAPESTAITVKEPYGEYTDKVHRINQSYSVFKYDSAFDVNEWAKSKSEFAQLIKRPDVTIRPKDYIPFATMSEFIQEVVNAMYYRKRKKGDRVRVYLEDPMRATSDPVYIIDDVATRNSNFFLSLPPAEVVSIEILTSKAKLKPLGLLGRNGVVIVNTKSGNARAEPLVTSNVVPGLSRSRQFKIPTHITPQFRATVYWNPSVHVDSNGKAIIRFPFTDDTAGYSLIVKGISSDGRFITSQSEIKPIIKPLE